MNNESDFIERRKEKRFTIQNGIVSIPKASSVIIGTILDISKGGISLRYPAQTNSLESSFELDILFTESNYYITCVPVTIVSDCELENQVPFSLINERRCGLQFKGLTEKHIQQIDTIVQNIQPKMGE